MMPHGISVGRYVDPELQPSWKMIFNMHQELDRCLDS